MKRILTVVLLLSLIVSSNFMVAKADDGVSIEVPTGEEWESIPERHEWPDPDAVMPRWKYTAKVSLYLTYTDDHANIRLDVAGYSDVTNIESVMVYEELVNGNYIERSRMTSFSDKSYLYKTWYPAATYGHTYRVTALVKVYSGSDYDYITCLLYTSRCV